MKKAFCILFILMFIMKQSGAGEGLIHEPSILPDFNRNAPVLQCKYFDEELFASNPIDKTAETVSSNAAELSEAFGGILPHHLVASPMMSRFFTTLREIADEPLTIVIMGPNHKRVGDRPIHTGAFSWKTPLGVMNSDEDMVRGLIEYNNAGVISGLLEEEHSVSVLIPYIHAFFPSAEIVPVLIHGNMKYKDCVKLSNYLIEEASKKPCLILASIDFSHGLKPSDALKQDEKTKNIIEQRDYDILFRLDNTYLDAPPTLASFLLTMDGLHAAKGDIDVRTEAADGSDKAQSILLEHSEASRFLDYPVDDTTSYMTYIFGE